ncbi:hypothetical protein ONZ45_g9340 [Pleurotus djamor]|nr:hypothetical protein ONZ45_g9340 [Pleurotus djamor]
MSVDEYGYTEEQRFNIEMRSLLPEDSNGGQDESEEEQQRPPARWPVVEGQPFANPIPFDPPSSPCSFRFHDWEDYGGGGQAFGYMMQQRKEESKERARAFKKEMRLASSNAARLAEKLRQRKKNMRKGDGGNALAKKLRAAQAQDEAHIATQQLLEQERSQVESQVRSYSALSPGVDEELSKHMVSLAPSAPFKPIPIAPQRISTPNLQKEKPLGVKPFPNLDMMVIEEKPQPTDTSRPGSYSGDIGEKDEEAVDLDQDGGNEEAEAEGGDDDDDVDGGDEFEDEDDNNNSEDSDGSSEDDSHDDDSDDSDDSEDSNDSKEDKKGKKGVEDSRPPLQPTNSKKNQPSEKTRKAHKADSEIVADKGDPSLVGKKPPKKGKNSRHSSRSSRMELESEDNTESLHRRSQVGAKHILSKFNYPDRDCRRLVERARTLLRQVIILKDAFPCNLEKVVLKILDEVCLEREERKFLKRLKRKRDDRLDDLIEYVSYCAPHTRNQVKAAAADVVCSAYSLLGRSNAEQVKAKVQWLSQKGHFHYGAANPESRTYNIQAPYSHSILSDIIRKLFFIGSKSSNAHKGIFTHMLDQRTIPIPMLALVLTGVQHSVSEYRDGYLSSKEFRSNDVEPWYRYHLRALDKCGKESGEWLSLLLYETWRDIMYQAKPGFLDVLASQDVSQEFDGVDFKALAASVPSSWKSGSIVDTALVVDTSPDTSPHSAPSPSIPSTSIPLVESGLPVGSPSFA